MKKTIQVTLLLALSIAVTTFSPLMAAQPTSQTRLPNLSGSNYELDFGGGSIATLEINRQDTGGNFTGKLNGVDMTGTISIGSRGGLGNTPYRIIFTSQGSRYEGAYVDSTHFMAGTYSVSSAIGRRSLPAGPFPFCGRQSPR